ncbi:hypothetical protein FGIG_00220 [Fasciola gigantica]|uniref:Uncharacterized protein n=1 Tax=Fasciola gigantica TaxID=46835 RepID=A0A504YG48_FASGI|nr:hypothetical protein FGIG_00220 [Fasciola gigantica]
MKWIHKNETETDVSSRPFITPQQRLLNLETSVQREMLEDFENYVKNLAGKMDDTTAIRSRYFCQTRAPSLSRLRPVCYGNLWVTPMFVGTSDPANGLEEAVIEATQCAITNLRTFLGTIDYSMDQAVHCWAVLNQPLESVIFDAFNRVYTSDAFGMPWELNPSLAAVHSERVFPPTRACFTVDPLLDPSVGTSFHSKAVAAVGLILVLCPLAVSAGRGALTGGPSVDEMHVRSLSHWAPASIGPYSQALSVRFHDVRDTDEEEQVDVEDWPPTVVTFYSGQIGLVPETMTLVDRDSTGHDINGQCWLTLRHCHRVTKIKCPSFWRGLFTAFCLGTSINALKQARESFHRAVCSVWFRSDLEKYSYIKHDTCLCAHSVIWAHVTDLPKQACVEWQWITVSEPISRVRIQYTDCLTRLDPLATLIFCNSSRLQQCMFDRGILVPCIGFLDRTEQFAVLCL